MKLSGDPYDEATIAVLNAPYGSKVRYHRAHEEESGRGTLTLVWFGITEVINIARLDGTKIHLHPELGDTAELID